MKVYLERVEPEADCYRFYAVQVMPTLFGEWALVREWGRMGQGGRVQDSVFDTEAKAVQAGMGVVGAKVRRGYRPKH